MIIRWWFADTSGQLFRSTLFGRSPTKIPGEEEIEGATCDVSAPFKLNGSMRHVFQPESRIRDRLTIQSCRNESATDGRKGMDVH